MFWIVESIINFSINMPKKKSYIFVVDIMQCYDNIPIHGEDNLGEAITFFFIDKACSQYYKQHYKIQAFCNGSKLIHTRLIMC